MRPHDDAQRPPECEKREREMTLLGKLSEIGIHKALRVYRCLPCQRIATTHDGGSGCKLTRAARYRWPCAELYGPPNGPAQARAPAGAALRTLSFGTPFLWPCFLS